MRKICANTAPQSVVIILRCRSTLRSTVPILITSVGIYCTTARRFLSRTKPGICSSTPPANIFATTTCVASTTPARKFAAITRPTNANSRTIGRTKNTLKRPNKSTNTPTHFWVPNSPNRELHRSTVCDHAGRPNCRCCNPQRRRQTDWQILSRQPASPSRRPYRHRSNRTSIQPDNRSNRTIDVDRGNQHS